MLHIPFDNRFARLGEPFFARAQPTPVVRPTLIKFNVELARELAKVLGATLVDDHHVVLSDASIMQIREQVAAIEARMLSGDIQPGSARARRLFS